MIWTTLGLLPLLCYGKDIILNPEIGDSTEIAISNGKYVWDSIQYASPGDTIILNNSQPMYYIPFDVLTNLYNITIQLHSDIYLHDNSSAWTFYEDTDFYLNAIDKLEKKLNTIVLSSNQALIWDTLVQINKNNLVEGFGKLFR